jgi:TRAP transporter TAXI family solute receptor
MRHVKTPKQRHPDRGSGKFVEESVRSSILMIVSAAAMTATSVAQAQVVGIGTSKQGGFTYSAGAAIAKVVGAAGLRMLVRPYGGSGVYVPAVNKGEIQFALANALETRYAVTGTGAYKDRQQPNIRVVAVMLPLRVAIFARKDSPIKSIADLKGKRVPGVFGAARTLKVLMDGQLANAGMSYKDVQIVKAAGIIGNANDFMAGKSDVFFFAVGSGKVLQVNAKVGGIRALPIDPSPAAMARLKKFVPVAYALKVKPGKRLAGIVKPTYVMAYPYLVLTSAKVSDDMAYKVAKAMHDNRKGMIGSFRAMAGFSPKRMVTELGPVKYHPGAIKFYKEKGMWK